MGYAGATSTSCSTSDSRYTSYNEDLHTLYCPLLRYYVIYRRKKNPTYLANRFQASGITNMPHKRAKRSIREQQGKERSALIISQYSSSSFPLIGLEAPISPHPAASMARASVPNASPSPPRGCWTPRESAQNIGRNVRVSKPTRRTRTTV